MHTDATREGRVRRGGLARTRSKCRRQLRQYLKQIPHQTIVRDLKDCRVRILVDRHDGPGILDAGQVLDRTADANRAIHVITDTGQDVQPLTAARTFLKLIEKEQPDLVILGKQAIDDDANQTGQMLATLWGRPQATFASKVEVAEGKATVTREVDAGLETLEVDLPAVVTTDLRLNEPRFIKLPDIMKAKSKPMESIPFADLGVEAGQGLKTTAYAPPPKRSKGVMVKDAAELVAALKQKGLL